MQRKLLRLKEDDKYDTNIWNIYSNLMCLPRWVQQTLILYYIRIVCPTVR